MQYLRVSRKYHLYFILNILLSKKARNGISRRPAKRSKRTKVLQTVKESYFKKILSLTVPKKPSDPFSPES